MKRIEIETLEFNEKTGKFDHSFRYREFEDDQVRDNDLCTICGVPAYPECIKTCSNYSGDLLKNGKIESTK